MPRPTVPEGLREVAQHRSSGSVVTATNYYNADLVKAMRKVKFDENGYPQGRPREGDPPEIHAVYHMFDLLKRLREGDLRDAHKVEERLLTGIGRLLAQTRTAINGAARDVMKIVADAEKLRIDRESKGLSESPGIKEVESLSDEELEEWVDPD